MAASSSQDAPVVQRVDGKEFERRVYEVLSEAAHADSKTARTFTNLEISGYYLWRWADVPAWALRKIGWHSCLESEMRRLYDSGEADGRGFAEYGGDWLALKEYKEYKKKGDEEGRWHAILGQDKDHRALSANELGTWFLAGQAVREFNRDQGWKKEDRKVSMVLCCPDREDSRITKGAQQKLKRVRFKWELEVLLVPFERTHLRPPEAERAPKGIKLVPFRDHLIVTRKATTAAAATKAARARPKGGHVKMVDLEKVTRPKDGKKRAYQASWASKITAAAGVHLLQGPPGIGKTQILGLLMGMFAMENMQNIYSPKGYLALFVGPYVDLNEQLLEKVAVHLEEQLGADWREKVVHIYQRPKLKGKPMPPPPPSLDAVKGRLAAGAKVFVATERSCETLYEFALHAIAQGYSLLIVKDEAHYNSRDEGWSTQLMRLAKLPPEGTPSPNGKKFTHRGVICTATPTQAVKDLCDHKDPVKGCIMTMDDAHHKYKVCSDYELVVPLCTEKADLEKDGLPVDIEKMATKDRLGAAALFTVRQMLEYGKRKCIAYAQNCVEAEKACKRLAQACALEEGVECTCELIVEDTKERKEKYEQFGAASTSRSDGEDGQVVILHFLVSVCILDFGIDIPNCDCISVLDPPKSSASEEAVKSAHRLIQRMGRAMRRYEEKALIMVFSGLKNSWLKSVGRVLRDFDPQCETRMRVSSANPAKKASKAIKKEEDNTLEEIKKTYDISGQRALAKKREREEEQEAKETRKRAREAGWEVEDKSPEEMAATLQKLGVERVCNAKYRIKGSDDPWKLCVNTGIGRNPRCLTCREKNGDAKKEGHLRKHSCPCSKWGATKCWNGQCNNKQKGDPTQYFCTTCRNGECTAESHAAKEAEVRAAFEAKKQGRHVAPAGGIKYPGNQEHGFMFKDKEKTVRPEPGESWTDDAGIKWWVCESGQECKARHGYINVGNLYRFGGKKCISCIRTRGTCPAASITAAGRAPVTCGTSGARNPANVTYEKGGNKKVYKGRCCNKICANAIAKVLYEHEFENVDYPEGFWLPEWGKKKAVRHVAPAGETKVPGNQKHGEMFKDREKTVRPEPGELWTDDAGKKWRVCEEGQACKAPHGFINVTDVTRGSGQKKCGVCAMSGTCPATAIAAAGRSVASCSASGATSQSEGVYENDGVLLWRWKGRCCNKKCAAAIAKVRYEHAKLQVAYPPEFKDIGVDSPPARAESPSSSSSSPGTSADAP